MGPGREALRVLLEVLLQAKMTWSQIFPLLSSTWFHPHLLIKELFGPGRGGLATYSPPLIFLNRTDPVRPFISGHVANSMAAEVIALLHSLLMAPESNAAQIWTTTAEKVSQRRILSFLGVNMKVGKSLAQTGT